MDLFVGDHGGGGGGFAGVRGAAFGPLRQGQDEDRAEVAGQEAQELAAEGGRPVLARLIAEQLEPVRLVAAFGLGQGEQDGAFFAAAVLGQVAVDGRFGPFIGEILAPALDVRGARVLRRALRGGCGVAGPRSEGSGLLGSDSVC